MSYIKSVFFVAMISSLAACGGGGENAGDATEFSLSPAEWKITYLNQSCLPSSPVPIVVTINGGQPPFRIVSSIPAALSVDRAEASGKNPTFQVTHLGGCLDPGLITVLDYHSKVATLAVTAEYELPAD